jgi:hypothetical protein
MKTEEIKVSLLQNHQTYQSKAVGLNEVLRLIKYDDNLRQKTEWYRDRAAVVSRSYANQEVKQKVMPVFSVSVLFNGMGKQMSHVVRFTGLALCDIDHIPPERMDEVLTLIRNDPHTLMAYVTVSKEGVRIIYWYQREHGGAVNGEVFPAAWTKGNSYYAQLTGVDYDKNCNNANRLSGMAHDPDAFYNPDAEPFVVNDSEMLDANFAPGTDSGRPRTEDPPGTHHASAEKAWEVVESMLAKRNMEYGPGHHHDYVLHATYIFNRLGTSLEELQEWAAQQWADYNANERKRCIEWVYQKRSGQHGSWRTGKSVRKGEVSMITITEICHWITEHHVEIVYNQVTDQTLYRNLKKSDEWLQVDERVVCSLRREMAMETGKRVLKNDVLDVIRSSYARLIHPVRDYISSLPTWDHQDRVPQLVNYIHVEPVQRNQTQEEARQLLEWAIHKWLVAAVAEWMSDDMSNQTILVLIGRQGIYKTTFFRYLLPSPLRSYFWENNHNSFASKDDHLALAENCFIDIEEIDMTRERDISELKALATSVWVKERRPYARFREAKHRLASFCATGNQQRFLCDETGNRRWLCFKVDSIDDPRQWTLDYQQLYAQLRDEYLNGFPHWFTTEEQERVEEQNKYFRIESDEEQLINTRFRKPQPDKPLKRLKASTICQILNNGHVGGGLSSRKVSLTMGKMGFKSIHTRSGSYFEVYEIPYDQIQSQIATEVIRDDSDVKNTNITIW